ncbi:MAG: recombination regulator RecX [Defluviitaleaceae bacterium]|nr:recombination regulator RecX [Defluviitaleaceae bacterium]MCL2837164.1 recombination regulator RecX [Defluviitaleaceae bacterium]
MDASFNETLAEAQRKALRLLSYGPRSKMGLYQKLRDTGFDHGPAEAAVDAMEAQGFVNDEKMAADYVALAIESKAHGRYRIIQELTRRGISKDLAETAYETYVTELAEQSADGEEADIDLENAVASLEKRMRQTGLEPDELDAGDIRRLTGFLHRRGFSFGTIRRAFSRIQDDY